MDSKWVVSAQYGPGLLVLTSERAVEERSVILAGPYETFSAASARATEIEDAMNEFERLKFQKVVILEKQKSMEINELVSALKDTLAAIKQAKSVGLFEHMDCWDEAKDLWYEPIRRAETLLKMHSLTTLERDE